MSYSVISAIYYKGKLYIYSNWPHSKCLRSGMNKWKTNSQNCVGENEPRKLSGPKLQFYRCRNQCPGLWGSVATMELIGDRELSTCFRDPAFILVFFFHCTSGFHTLAKILFFLGGGCCSPWCVEVPGLATQAPTVATLIGYTARELQALPKIEANASTFLLVFPLPKGVVL